MTTVPQAIPLQIDIVSDVVCPWCIIGYKQLQKALAMLPDRFEVALRWHPFELNPRMTEQGQDLREHLAEKYGTTPEQSKAARERLTALGDALGFHFDYFDGMRMANTFRAHQLLHWAQAFGKQTDLKLALFEAFFSLREDINNSEVMLGAVKRVGLPLAQAAEVLADQRFARAVREEQQLWIDRDIHAVPTFIFNQQFMVPGAQDAQVFVRVLEKVSEPCIRERQPAHF